MVSRLDEITRAIAEEVGVHSCAITLFGRPVDGSDEIAAELEDWQFVLAEGPALAAFQCRRPVEHADVVAAAARYPLLAEHLIGAGIRSIAAFPVVEGSQCLGTVTLYSTAAQPLRRHQRRGGVRWANRVALAVRADHHTWASRRHLVTPDFDVATGCVMASSGVPAADAATLIRAHAFASATPLRSLCRRIIHDGFVLPARQ